MNILSGCLTLCFSCPHQVGSPLPGRQATSAVVDDWGCLREMVGVWRTVCNSGEPMDQFAMRHTRFFANLCNAGVGAEALQVALRAAGCSMETLKGSEVADS